jgi:chromosomal replication initiator protein
MPNNVLEFIASKVNTNVRELEGAYLQVLTLATTLGQDATVDTAARALGQSVKEEKSKPLNLNTIIKAVCNYYSVNPTELKGKDRSKEIVIPRQVAMYLMYTLTGTPFMTIGELLGGRDHTTIMHGVKKMEDEIKQTERTKQDIQNVKQIIMAE